VDYEYVHRISNNVQDKTTILDNESEKTIIKLSFQVFPQAQFFANKKDPCFDPPSTSSRGTVATTMSMIGIGGRYCHTMPLAGGDILPMCVPSIG
jgi:hypothetical protein